MNRTIAFAAAFLGSLVVIGTFQNCAPTLPLDGVVDSSSVAVRATATPGGGAATGIGTVINNPSGTNFDGVCTWANSDDAMAFSGVDGAGRLLAFNKGTTGVAAFWNIAPNGTLARGSVCHLAQSGYTVQAIGDFSGDFNPDVLWRNASGDVVIWLMRGSSRIQTAQVATILPSLNIEGVADFDGDGKDDLLLRDTNNSLSIMKMNGLGTPTPIAISNSVTATQSVAAISSYLDQSTYKKKIAIFFNDSNPGTVPAGQAASKPVWYMNGTSVASASFLPIGFIQTTTTVNNAPVVTNYNILGIGDFTGEGNADFLLADAATGLQRIRYSNYNGTNLAVYGADSSPDITPNPAWALQDVAKVNGDNTADWIWIDNSLTPPGLRYTPLQVTPGVTPTLQFIQPGYTFFKYSHR